LCVCVCVCLYIYKPMVMYNAKKNNDFIYNELLTLSAWWMGGGSNRFKSRQSFFQYLILLDRIYSLCATPIDMTCHETSFSNSLQMDTHLFFAQKFFFSRSMQMSSHIFSLLKNSSFQTIYKLVPMSSFLKIFVKLQVAYPTHEQIKYVQSSMKSTQVWSSIKNFSLQTNPLPTNPIDSNQLSLKFFLEINRALEASWKFLSIHVWWCYVSIFVSCSFYLWWIAYIV